MVWWNVDFQCIHTYACVYWAEMWDMWLYESQCCLEHTCSLMTLPTFPSQLLSSLLRESISFFSSSGHLCAALGSRVMILLWRPWPFYLLILCQALLEIQMILIFNRPMGFWEQLERAQLRRGQIFPKLKISVLNSSSSGNEHNHGNNLCLFHLLLHSFIKYLLKAYCVLGCILSARFYK